MKIVCVDDEPLLLNTVVSLCKKLPQQNEVITFTKARKALEWFDNNKADIALLDIEIPDLDGLTLAAGIKVKSPNTAVIFLTGYSQYAVDAFKVRASGYILKPIKYDRLAEEIEYALKNMPHIDTEKRVVIKTFCQFEVFVDGKIVTFSREKSKEMLAYLVDRQGSRIKRQQLAGILFEDVQYDRNIQKQLDVIMRSMRDTLKTYDLLDIVELSKGYIRVVPEKVDCDLYRFFEGDTNAINSYRGEYMNEYSWASLTEAYLYRKKMDMGKGN